MMNNVCILVENLLPSWFSSFRSIEIEDQIKVNVHDLRPGIGNSETEGKEWMLGFSEQIKNKLLERLEKSDKKSSLQVKKLMPLQNLFLWLILSKKKFYDSSQMLFKKFSTQNNIRHNQIILNEKW